jgi:hypothetical protein
MHKKYKKQTSIKDANKENNTFMTITCHYQGQCQQQQCKQLEQATAFTLGVGAFATNFP